MIPRVQRLAFKKHVSRSGLAKPGEQRQERRLAGPVGPEQAENLTGVDLEGDARKRPGRAVGVGDIANFEQGGRHCGIVDIRERFHEFPLERIAMLSRVLEPEVMDAADEARDYDAMDHSQVNRVFAADFLDHFATDGTVLDVGTGTAQIPIELCRQRPGLRFVAIDAAPSMLDIAKENVARAGLADRITLQQVDAKGLPFAERSFAAIVSNSIVHHIPHPATVLAEIVRVVTPGGVVFVRDLLRPVSDREVHALVNQYAADCNAHQRSLFDASLRAALTLDEMRGLVSDLGYHPGTVQATSDRHWTWAAKTPSA